MGILQLLRRAKRPEAELAGATTASSTTPVAALAIDAAAWESAAAGFNARVSASPAFARHFNTLHRAARVRAS